MSERVNVFACVIAVVAMIALAVVTAGCSATVNGNLAPMASQAPAQQNGNGTCVQGPSNVPSEAYLRISEGSPGIDVGMFFHSIDVDDEPMVFIGSINDTSVTQVEITLNGITDTTEVAKGKFSYTANITGASRITFRAVDANGTTLTREMVLDGDALPAAYEALCGFDPQDPDSDSVKTAVNEGDNGVVDGEELLDGKIPAVIKFRLGIDPFSEDTDGDGLSDLFESTRTLGFAWPDKADSDGDGVPDPLEDIDGDGLTNVKEQEYGTDPIKPDSDGDKVPDGTELLNGTNASSQDTDHDKLDDGLEKECDTNPLIPDTDGDGITDGDDTVTLTRKAGDLPATVSVTGPAGKIRDTRIVHNRGDVRLNGIMALAGPPVSVDLDPAIERAVITIPYDEEKVKAWPDPYNLSMLYVDQDLGCLRRMDSTVDTRNHTVTGAIDHAEPDAYAGYTDFVVIHLPTYGGVWIP